MNIDRNYLKRIPAFIIMLMISVISMVGVISISASADDAISDISTEISVPNLPNNYKLIKQDPINNKRLSGVTFRFDVKPLDLTDDGKPKNQYDSASVDAAEVIGYNSSIATAVNPAAAINTGAVLVTDSNGEININRLVDGIWYYTETDLGTNTNDGYTLPMIDGELIHRYFIVKDGVIIDPMDEENTGKDITVTADNYNAPVETAVLVEKRDEKTKELLSGATFVVLQYDSIKKEYIPYYKDYKKGFTLVMAGNRIPNVSDEDFYTATGVTADAAAIGNTYPVNAPGYPSNATMECISVGVPFILTETSPGVYEGTGLEFSYKNLGYFRIEETYAPAGYCGKWARDIDTSQNLWKFKEDFAAFNKNNELHIFKYDINTLAPLAKAQFMIYVEDPSVITPDPEGGVIIGYQPIDNVETGETEYLPVYNEQILITDPDGDISIVKLLPDTEYHIVETKAAPGYYLTTEIFNVPVGSNGSIYNEASYTLDIPNRPTPNQTELHLMKTDNDFVTPDNPVQAVIGEITTEDSITHIPISDLYRMQDYTLYMPITGSLGTSVTVTIGTETYSYTLNASNETIEVPLKVTGTTADIQFMSNRPVTFGDIHAELVEDHISVANALEGVTFKITNVDLGDEERIALDADDNEIYNNAEFVTDADGRISLYRLEPGTYEITETATVEGYRLLRNKIELTVSGSYKIIGPANTEIDGDDIYYLNVVNNKIWILPTGGRGRILIYAIGGALLVGILILILIVTRKKKDDDEDDEDEDGLETEK